MEEKDADSEPEEGKTIIYCRYNLPFDGKEVFVSRGMHVSSE